VWSRARFRGLDQKANESPFVSIYELAQRSLALPD